MFRLASFLLSVLLVGSFLVVAGWWWQVEEEVAPVTILAAWEPELGVPVFAQFTVTQTVRLAGPALVTRVVVPMYVPQVQVPLTVSLRQDGVVIGRWRLHEVLVGEEGGIHQASFVLATPRVLSGVLEIHFEGSGIDHVYRDVAPRVFVESFDAAYPEGSYRIAANEKEGDVSLQVYASMMRGERLVERWRDEPWRGVAWVSVALAMVVLMWLLPGVFGRGTRNKE